MSGISESSKRKQKKKDINSNLPAQKLPKEEPTNDQDKVDKPMAEVDHAKKPKKRKAKDADADNEGVQLHPPKKKRKNRTEFADPRKDSKLSSQPRKALEYAFLHMNNPSKWKFNKARQNWIVRNLWTPEALPEAYFPLALKCLSKIEGGSRLKLLGEAQKILHPEAEPKQGEAITSSVKPTPGPLIGTDSPIPGPSVDSEPASTAKVSKAHARTEIKKTRAQKFLELLSSNTEKA